MDEELAPGDSVRRLLELVGVPVCTISPNQRVTGWNSRAAKMSGYTKDEAIGKSFVEWFVALDSRTEVSDVLQQALSGVEIVNHEFKFVTKDNEERVILFSSTSQYNSTNEVVEVIVVCQDVTRICRATESFTDLYPDDYQRLIETAHVPIFCLDRMGGVTVWNSKISQLLGASKSEVHGTHFVQSFVPAEFHQSANEVIENALAGRATLSYELPLISKPGRRLTLLMNLSVQNNANGDVVGVVGTGQDITHYNTALNEIMDAADDLRRLIDSANAPIFAVDDQGKVTDWNRAASLLSGYSKEELIGEPLVDQIVTAEYRDSLSDVLQNALNGVETANFEIPLHTRDGRRRDLLLSTTSRRGPDGEVNGVVGVGQDITYIRSVAEKNAQVADSFSKLIETANAPIFSVDTERKVIQWNAKIVEISGLAEQEVLGRSLVNCVITQEHRAAVSELLQKALAGVATTTQEFRLSTNSGRHRDIIWSVTTRRDANGTVIGAMVLGQDITDVRKKLSEARRAADDLQRLLETASAIRFSVDPTGKVTDWNRKASQMSGFSKEDVVGKSFVESLIATENRNTVEALLQKVICNEKIVNYQLPLNTKDGEARVVLVNAIPRHGVDGAIIGVVGMGTDITDLCDSMAKKLRGEVVGDLTSLCGLAVWSTHDNPYGVQPFRDSLSIDLTNVTQLIFGKSPVYTEETARQITFCTSLRVWLHLMLRLHKRFEVLISLEGRWFRFAGQRTNKGGTSTLVHGEGFVQDMTQTTIKRLEAERWQGFWRRMCQMCFRCVIFVDQTDYVIKRSWSDTAFFGQSLEGTNIHQWVVHHDHANLKSMFVSATVKGKQRAVNIHFVDNHGQYMEGACYCLVDDADPSGILLAVRFKKQDMTDEAKEKASGASSSSAAEAPVRLERPSHATPQQQDTKKAAEAKHAVKSGHSSREPVEKKGMRETKVAHNNELGQRKLQKNEPEASEFFQEKLGVKDAFSLQSESSSSQNRMSAARQVAPKVYAGPASARDLLFAVADRVRGQREGKTSGSSQSKSKSKSSQSGSSELSQFTDHTLWSVTDGSHIETQPTVSSVYSAHGEGGRIRVLPPTAAALEQLAQMNFTTDDMVVRNTFIDVDENQREEPPRRARSCPSLSGSGSEFSGYSGSDLGQNRLATQFRQLLNQRPNRQTRMRPMSETPLGWGQWSDSGGEWNQRAHSDTHACFRPHDPLGAGGSDDRTSESWSAGEATQVVPQQQDQYSGPPMTYASPSQPTTQGLMTGPPGVARFVQPPRLPNASGQPVLDTPLNFFSEPDPQYDYRSDDDNESQGRDTFEDNAGTGGSQADESNYDTLDDSSIGSKICGAPPPRRVQKTQPREPAAQTYNQFQALQSQNAPSDSGRSLSSLAQSDSTDGRPVPVREPPRHRAKPKPSVNAEVRYPRVAPPPESSGTSGVEGELSWGRRRVQDIDEILRFETYNKRADLPQVLQVIKEAQEVSLVLQSLIKLVHIIEMHDHPSQIGPVLKIIQQTDGISTMLRAAEAGSLIVRLLTSVVFAMLILRSLQIPQRKGGGLLRGNQVIRVPALLLSCLGECDDSEQVQSVGKEGFGMIFQSLTRLLQLGKPLPPPGMTKDLARRTFDTMKRFPWPNVIIGAFDFLATTAMKGGESAIDALVASGGVLRVLWAVRQGDGSPTFEVSQQALVLLLGILCAESSTAATQFVRWMALSCNDSRAMAVLAAGAVRVAMDRGGSQNLIGAGCIQVLDSAHAAHPDLQSCCDIANSLRQQHTGCSAPRRGNNPPVA